MNSRHLYKVADPTTCPVCQVECNGFDCHFSREGTWCNHAGWVLRTGVTRDDPPLFGPTPVERVDGAIPL